MQRIAGEQLGVVILFDDASVIQPAAPLPPVIQNRTWILRANCGSAARSRNAILEFVDENLPLARWIARLDYDDRFSGCDSLASAVEIGDRHGGIFVLGGNRVVTRTGSLIRENPASMNLRNPAKVLDQIRAMAEGRAENELPSCNLLLAARSGLRYPDTSSAEDHWLVANLLVNHADQGVILEGPFYADYTLAGDVTRSATASQKYWNARRSLTSAVETWLRVRELPGRVLGLGQEGIVRTDDGTVYKHFYRDILTDEKVRWLEANLHALGPHLPNPQFAWNTDNEAWVATYRWEETSEAVTVEPEAVKAFLSSNLRHRYVCGNIKRANFRVNSAGDLVYIDIGNWIVPMDVSIFRDAAARLYSIGVLGWPDEEILRRPTVFGREEIWHTLPGYQDFLRDVVTSHAFSSALRSSKEATVHRSHERNARTSLLIKACAMDAAFVRGQVVHIVDQLVGPQDFAERILLIDPFEGPFLREHSPGDLRAVMMAATELQSLGLLDRVVIAPDDRQAVQQVYQRWFGLACEQTHTALGVPISPQLWAFDQVRTRYLLQCDLDVLIGRTDIGHDFLDDMLNACQSEEVLGVAFNIPHPAGAPVREYQAPPGEYVPEVRCGLLDLERIRACQPLPNHLVNGRMELTWYRSLQQHQRRHGLKTLRGGNPATFYIHPPNSRKSRPDIIGMIRDQVSQGIIPPAQYGHWDLEAPDEAWRYPRRSEEIIVLARGRDTPESRVRRFGASLRAQSDQAFGVIVIDDASDEPHPGMLREELGWLGNRLTLVRNPEHRGRMINLVAGIRHLCTDARSLVVIVDLDDALLDHYAISRIRHLRHEGHDVILAAPFMPDRPAHVFFPNFQHPRSTWGGDVWIHLRAFTKGLFDLLPDDCLQIEGAWIDQCTDYATMVPIVENARNPVYLPEYLYWHERRTVLDERQRHRRDEIITAILAKGSGG